MLNVSHAHLLFRVAVGLPDLLLNCHYGSMPEITMGNQIWAPGERWGLYKRGKKFILPIDCHPEAMRLAILNESFSHGEVYFRPSLSTLSENLSEKSSQEQVSIAPFDYPLDEVVMINFLARGRGVILHSCGVADDGRGLLFAGVSGAGKSTLAKLWEKTDATLLSDDRIIVRRINGRFRMYGTPWHGDADIASPESVPLERLFFTEHASRNYVREVSPTYAAARLLVRCFPPFYDREGMEFTMDLLSQIAEEVPCCELGFVPDTGIIDFVRGL